MEPLADYASGFSRDQLATGMLAALAVPWLVVIPLLKMRGPEKGKTA